MKETSQNDFTCNTDILVICFGYNNSELSLVWQAVKLAEKCHAMVKVLFCVDNVSSLYDSMIPESVAQIYALPLANNSADDLAIAKEIVRYCKTKLPNTILSNATIRGRSILPMVAALLQTGLTADCTDLFMESDGNLIQIRPAMGSRVTARIICSRRPQMATVRPGVFPAVLNDVKKMTITNSNLTLLQKSSFEPHIKNIGFTCTQWTDNLTQAKFIIAGGMGVGSADGFKQLEALAKAYGGCAGATRTAVSAGYAPYAWQVGQTGVVVRPKLYIAIGISGAVQHLIGMSGSQRVVAINNDSRAPILDYADYAIIADWKEVLPRLKTILQQI